MGYAEVFSFSILNVPNILLAITVILNIVLNIFGYSRRSKNPINTSFGFITIFLSFWALVILNFRLTDDITYSLYLLKASYVIALGIAASYYYFSLVFPEGSPL